MNFSSKKSIIFFSALYGVRHRLFALFCFLIFGIYAAPSARALAVSPSVIDEKALPRDTINRSVRLQNDTAGRLRFYVLVENILLDAAVAYEPTLANSLMHWLEVTHGMIELAPEEAKDIPLSISVNMRAKPGIYHAQVLFLEGTDRANAQDRRLGAEKVLLNVEVLEDIRERLQLKKFVPAKTFFSALPASFLYTVENIGNRPLKPEGSIVIYDRSGREVGALALGEGSETVPPDGILQLASIWNGKGGANEENGSLFGRYKAILQLSYGADDRRLQDTVFFWILPWYILLFVFGALAVSAVFAASWWHKRRYGPMHTLSGDAYKEAQLRHLAHLPLAPKESITHADSESRDALSHVAVRQFEEPPRSKPGKKPLHASRHVVNLKDK